MIKTEDLYKLSDKTLAKIEKGQLDIGKVNDKELCKLFNIQSEKLGILKNRRTP